MSLFSGLRARLQLLFAGRAAESRMDREIDFHIEMETDRLVRDEGLPPDEARRRALATFGGVTHHREALRDGRGLAWLTGMGLDMKLGFRMLRKYPGLTLVGGLAMAFAIWVGAVTFEVTTLFLKPTLPLHEGDRVVQIENWDREASSADQPSVGDFVVWREALSSVTQMGAYRGLIRNLASGDGDPRPVHAAEVTASAFQVAAVAPLMGRVLLPEDEREGAPVVVLGYDVWKTRFGSDPDMVGRTLRLGESPVTVVGVMPEEFAFPVAHEAWVPLQVDAFAGARGGGPGVSVFGRLAPGVTLDEAQAELAVLGDRAAADFPETHRHLEPRVAAYTESTNEQSPTGLMALGSIYLFAIMLLVLVCSNVALLLFARAATREGELVVRSALGASRGRIVIQLFTEALVLGGVAAVAGLLAARLALRTWGVEFLEINLGRLPFWIDPRLSALTVVYALGLTVLGAVIAGVLPALKITRGIGSRLKQGTAGGGGVQFGGVWTVVIIAQVAVTVAFPSIVAIEQRELRRIEAYDVGFKAEEYLGVSLELDAPSGSAEEADPAVQGARYGAALEELRRRVAAEPGVAGVTFVDELPRMFHLEAYMEVEEPGGHAPPHEVSTARIDPSYFDVLQRPIVAGRAFYAGEAIPDARVVIVDQAFVDQVLQGANPIGRRIRFSNVRQDGDAEQAPQPWLEIVGLAKDLGMTFMAHQHRAAGVYFPADLGAFGPADLAAAGPLNMVVHAPEDPIALAPRVRELAAAVDPMLRVVEVHRLDQVTNMIEWFIKLWLRVSILLTAVALLLSLAGIYSVLSFTVARRTREIGVRVALGASRPRLIAAIFRRPLTHVTIGVAAGAMLIFMAASALAGSDGNLARVEGGLSVGNVALLLGYAALMLGICLLACIVPTTRALRVEPTEALKAE